MNVYDAGDQVKISVTFTNESGAVANPTTVSAKLLSPTGTLTTPTPTNEGTGIYYFYAAIPAVSSSYGAWYYRYESGDSNGSALAAAEGTFMVRRSAFY
jgi:hypothetical protein